MIAPTLICMKPIRAEALPAFLLNGAIERADTFGNMKPWQLKKINIKIIVEYSSLKPNIESETRTIPMAF